MSASASTLCTDAASVAVAARGAALAGLTQAGRVVPRAAGEARGRDVLGPDGLVAEGAPRVAEADRERAQAYGIAPGHLNEQLSALVGGKEVAELRDGSRSQRLKAILG